MKRRETIKRFLLLLFAAALFAWFIPAAAAEQRDSLVENAAQSARDAGVPAEDVAVIVARSLQRGVDSGTVARFLDAAAASTARVKSARDPFFERTVSLSCSMSFAASDASAPRAIAATAARASAGSRCRTPLLIASSTKGRA